MKSKFFSELIISLFILLFVYTATSKWFDFASFEHVLSKSPLIGKMSGLVAWTLPILEILIAILLLFTRSRRLGLWLSLIIMILFTGYLGYMIYFTPDRPCSCGGVIRQMTWKQHLLFNIFFILLAALEIWRSKKKHTSNLELNSNVKPSALLFF